MSIMEAESSPSNGKEGRKQWWQYMPIPESWHMVADRDQPYRGENRDRESIDLDDTRTGYRRRYEDGPPSGPRLQVPLSVVVSLTIYLVGQLIAGIWWAATLQSNLQHEISDRAKEEGRLWDGIQTYRAESNALRLEVARLTGNNRRQKEEE